MKKKKLLFIAFYLVLLFLSCNNPQKEELINSANKEEKIELSSQEISYCSCIGIRAFIPLSKESKQWEVINKCNTEFPELVELDSLPFNQGVRKIEKNCPEIKVGMVDVCRCVSEVLNSTYQDTSSCNQQIKLLKKESLTKQVYFNRKSTICINEWEEQNGAIGAIKLVEIMTFLAGKPYEPSEIFK